MDEPVISRDKAIALLFTVNDISRTLVAIEILLKGENGEEDDES